jgi:hypothetical protein
MASVLRSALAFAFVSTLAVLSVPGCADQGEGERCDKTKAQGSGDCDSGLICVAASELLEGITDLCCPPDGQESSERCTRRGKASTTGGTSSGGSGGSSSSGSAGESAGGSPETAGGAGGAAPSGVGSGGESAAGGVPSSAGGVPGAGGVPSSAGASLGGAGQGGGD